ncbi:tetratricopeptide repeat protein [Treponema primitia]|uniref:tetratricopeptide repeat protein n=1 Tax=Treponema primitia TaxID=88058 RepID=UPI00397FB424
MKGIHVLSAALVFAALCAVAGCAGTPAVSGLMSLDEAMAGAAAVVEGKVEGGAEIVVSKIDSQLPALSDFLNAELSDRFGVNGKLTVLARGKAAESVNVEQNYQMSGLVSDESAVGIGHDLGAKVVITGTFEFFGNFSQLRIRAIDVLTKKLVATYPARISNNDAVLASITSPLAAAKPAAIQENALEYFNRGKDFYAAGNYDEAIAELDKALAINANLSEAFLYRCNAYYWKGDNDRAIADYTAALKINPNYTDALNNRGNAYYNKRDYDRAIADYTAALKINPNYTDALYNRGNVYRTQDDYNKAIADYTAALKIDPNYANALHNRGVTYYEKGDYDKAIVDFTARLKINPNDSVVEFLLEIIREEQEPEHSSEWWDEPYDFQ